MMSRAGMLRSLIIIVMLITGMNQGLAAGTSEEMLQRLDTIVSRGEEYAGMRQQRLDELSRRYAQSGSDVERSRLNATLYETSYVFDSDSALKYVERGLGMATQAGDRDAIAEWRIRESFVLAATGLLKEAEEVLSEVDESRLAPHLYSDYYNQKAYLYSHLGQYSTGALSQHYYQLSRQYEDSLLAHSASDNPVHVWAAGWRATSREDRRPVIDELRRAVDGSELNTRLDAMSSYALASLYKFEQMRDSAVYYFAASAIADITTANREMAALQDLGQLLYEEGDIDRAFSYINYSLQTAQLYHNRVRMLELSKLERDLGQVYSERNEARQRRVWMSLWVIIGLLVILIIGSLLLYKQVKTLRKTRQALSSANSRLEGHIEEINESHSRLAEAHEEMKKSNDALGEANNSLAEANFIKEQCISSMFGLCSDYIDHMEGLHKEVSRKLKAKQYDDLLKLVGSKSRTQNQLKEFYGHLDRTVLEIYPKFIEEFNSLLRPEERMSPRPGEHLNTTMRIYALVRLGITDSVKIATMLHCSVQTVYNNRMTTRRKATESDIPFAERVRRLGKPEIGAT